MGDGVSAYAWVRRPFAELFELALALVVLAMLLYLAERLFGDSPPFSGRFIKLGADAFVVLLWIILALAVAGVMLSVLFAVVAPAVGRSLVPPARDGSSAGAMVELKKRYARGEVPREEFLRRLGDLETAARGPAGTAPAPGPAAPAPK